MYARLRKLFHYYRDYGTVSTFIKVEQLIIKYFFRTIRAFNRTIKHLYCVSKNAPILKELIKDQKILIMGSGLSAGELEQIPEGVKVFTCNAGPRLFVDKKLDRAIDLFLCSKNKMKRRVDIEELVQKNKIKIFIINDLGYIKKKKKLQGIYSKLVFDDDTSNYYLKKLIKPYTIEQITEYSDRSWTSSGVRLLQYALYFGAKEVYLIGIDINESGYFWGEKNNHRHLVIDENFINIVSKKYSNIYSLSRNSPITRYIPYKNFGGTIETNVA